MVDLGPLRERNFRLLAGARTISFFGTNLAPIALRELCEGWQAFTEHTWVWLLTGWISLYFLVTYAPFFVLIKGWTYKLAPGRGTSGFAAYAPAYQRACGVPKTRSCLQIRGFRSCD